MISAIVLALFGILGFVVPRKTILFSLLFVSLWLEWNFPQIMGIRIGIIDMLVIATVLSMAIEPDRYFWIDTHGMGFCVFGYIAISMIAVWLNPDAGSRRLTQRIWEVYKAVYISLLFFIFVIAFKEPKRLRLSVKLFIVSSVFSACLGIVQGVFQIPLTIAAGSYADAYNNGALFIMSGDKFRAFGTLWAANDFGNYLMLPLAVAGALIVIDYDIRRRKVLIAGTMVLFAAFLLTFARSSWIGFATTAAVIVWLTKLYKNRMFLLGAIGLFVAVIILSNISGLDVFGRMTSVKNFRNDPAMLPRFIRWRYFFNRSLERPFIGFGTVADPATFEFFNYDAVSPHNTYLSVAVRRGYVAVAFIAIIIFKSLAMSYHVFKNSPHPFERAIGLGVFTGFIGLCLVSGFLDAFLEETQVNIVFWYLVAITVRLYHKLKTTEVSIDQGT